MRSLLCLARPIIKRGGIINYGIDEPIAAIATPLYSSALAIVRTSGKGSLSILAKVFSRPASLLNAEGNTIVYGFIVFEGEVIDEVLVSVFRSPKSYTGEEMAEISCHGSVLVVQNVFRTLLNAGFRIAERGEFTLRSFLHGKTDLTRAEAVKEVIDSSTTFAASRALKRLKGSLFTKINEIKASLVGILAEIEAEVEYPEDENAVKNAFDLQNLHEVLDELTRLVSSWNVERVYQQGVVIALSGRVNAGKSSLFNAILQEERAIVSDVAGTTRDYVECTASFMGLPVRLFDTAGLRLSKEAVEEAGIKKAREVIEKADGRLYLIDSTTGSGAEDMKELSASNCPTIVVWSKTDLAANRKNTADFSKIACIKGEVEVSSKTREGLDSLYTAVRSLFDKAEDASLFSKEVALGSRRQRDCVLGAEKSVAHALRAVEEGMPNDAVMEDIEDALEKLGECTGEVKAEDILENIFSRFCVGK